MIARQSGIVLANNIVGAGLGLVVLFLMVRYMGAEIVGMRAYALTLVSLLGIVARLGFPTTHVQRLGQGEDVAASNGTYLVLKSLLATAFALLALGAGWVWFVVLGRSTTDTTPTALWLAFGIILVQAIRDVPVNTFQGLRRIGDREAVLASNTLVTVVLTAWVAIAFAASHGRWTPAPGVGAWLAQALGATSPMTIGRGVDLAMWAFFVGEVAALALAILLFVRARIPIGRPRPGMYRTYLAFTAPVMLLALGETVGKWLSLVMVGFWWDAKEVGQYYAAAKLTEGFLLLPLSMAVVLLPTLSRLHRRTPEEARSLALEAERWVSIVSWAPLAVILAANAACVHILLSGQFTRAGPILAVLGGQALISGLLVPAQTLAVAMGKPALAARIILISLAVDIVLDVLLVPDHIGPLHTAGLGGLGAAVASLLAALVALVWYAAAGLARPLRLARHAFAAVGCALVFGLLPEPTRFWNLALYGLLLASAYLALLAALGEVHRRDFANLRALLRPEPA